MARRLPMRLLFLGMALALSLAGMSMIASAQADPGPDSDSEMATLNFGVDANGDGRFNRDEPLKPGQDQVTGRLVVVNTTDAPLDIEWAKIDDVTIGGMCAHMNGYRLAARAQVNCDLEVAVDGPAKLTAQIAILQGRVLDRSFSTAEVTKPTADQDDAEQDLGQDSPENGQATPAPKPTQTPGNAEPNEPVVVIVDDEPAAEPIPVVIVPGDDGPPDTSVTAVPEPPDATPAGTTPGGDTPVVVIRDEPQDDQTGSPQTAAAPGTSARTPDFDVAATISTDLALSAGQEAVWHSPRALVQIMLVNRDVVPVRPTTIKVGDIDLANEACGALVDRPVPPAGAVNCSLVVDIAAPTEPVDLDVRVVVAARNRTSAVWKRTLTVHPNPNLAGLDGGDAVAAPGRPNRGDRTDAVRVVIDPETPVADRAPVKVKADVRSQNDVVVAAPAFQIAIGIDGDKGPFVRITDLVSRAMIELPLSDLISLVPAVPQAGEGLVGAPLPLLGDRAGAPNNAGVSGAQFASNQLFAVLTAHSPLERNATFASWAQQVADQGDEDDEETPTETTTVDEADAADGAETDDEINENIQDFVAGTFQQATDPQAEVLGATVERGEVLASTGTVNSMRMTVGGAALLILGVSFVVLDRQRARIR